MADEVREFHLDGKQLAFLVISAIGLAVVVFLCGVMVGRGVRQTRANDVADAAPSILVDPAIDPAAPSLDLPVTADGTVRDSGARPDSGRLAPERTPDIAREPPPGPPRAVASAPEPSASAPAPQSSVTPPPPARTAAAPSAATKTPRDTPRQGYAVQVNAVKSAAEADRHVKKLKSKGYPSYTAPRGELIGVRVGSYPTRAEAEAVRARLEKEGDYKNPWVVPAP